MKSTISGATQQPQLGKNDIPWKGREEEAEAAKAKSPIDEEEGGRWVS